MTVEEAGLKAESLFKNGYNCAQSVAAVFAKEVGLDEELILKLSKGFGGGLGRQREVCGSVSAMTLIVSYLLGDDDSKDKNAKDECYKVIQSLCSRFREKNGSIICRELLGLVPVGQSEDALKNKTSIEHKVESSVSEERTPEYYKKRPCAHLCKDAAEILAEYLQKKN